MEFELSAAHSKLVDFEHKEKQTSSHSQSFMREINRLHDEVRELQARQGEYDLLVAKARLVDAKDAEIAKVQLQLEEYLKELEWMRKEHANALLMHTHER